MILTFLIVEQNVEPSCVKNLGKIIKVKISMKYQISTYSRVLVWSNTQLKTSNTIFAGSYILKPYQNIPSSQLKSQTKMSFGKTTFSNKIYNFEFDSNSVLDGGPNTN